MRTPKYCCDCGTELELRWWEGGSYEPWCTSCEKWACPTFAVLCNMLVVHPDSEHMLIVDESDKQAILPAGYMGQSERPADTVVRLLDEWTGLGAKDLTLGKIHFMEPRNLLMVDVVCQADGEKLDVSQEGPVLRWASFEEALRIVPPDSMVQSFIVNYLVKRGK